MANPALFLRKEIAPTAGALLLALALLACALPAEAQKRGGGRMGMGEPPGAEAVERREGEVAATGLTAVFPDGHVCEPISSPFGSPTRYDGSPRRDDRHGGLHGGMDLSLREGTPLLAAAAGRVIAKGAGGRLEGNYLWLLHAPADTGLPFWAYVKYQHLAELPALNEGDAVAAGQVVAASGSTGTAGGHYGAAGYPHLHMSLAVGPSDEFTRAGAYGSMVKGRDARLVDPLILYMGQVDDLQSVAALPPERKRLHVPFVGDDGSVHPAGSKVVWPVRCRRAAGS